MPDIPLSREQQDMVLQWMPLVRKVMRALKRTHSLGVILLYFEEAEILEFGYVGLCRAASSYIPGKGAEFKAWAWDIIRCEIIEYACRRTNPSAYKYWKSTSRQGEGAWPTHLNDSESREEDEEPPLVLIDKEAELDHQRSVVSGIIQEAVQQLSPQEQEVLRKKYWEGLGGLELANSLGLSEARVNVILQRTLLRLKHLLRPAYIRGLLTIEATTLPPSTKRGHKEG